MVGRQKSLPFVPFPCSHSQMPRETGLFPHSTPQKGAKPWALRPREGEVEIVAYSIVGFAQVQQPLSPTNSSRPSSCNLHLVFYLPSLSVPQSLLVLALKALFSSVYSFLFSPPHCFKAAIVHTMSSLLGACCTHSQVVSSRSRADMRAPRRRFLKACLSWYGCLWIWPLITFTHLPFLF